MQHFLTIRYFSCLILAVKTKTLICCNYQRLLCRVLQGFAGFYNTELELYILLNRKGFQMVPENPTLEQLEAEFYKDQFATHAAHCRIIEGKKGYAVCEMPIETIHRNGMGNVMGGAIFTLADFALAIAGNVGQPPTVSVTHSIDFFRPSKGTKLIATARCDKAGSRLAFFTVEITDDLGKDIARMTATCARV